MPAMSSQAICNASEDAMRLPVEILTHIFRAACCIDAHFHLTLRLVSRLCRDIARPLKYCSMFIHGPTHLRVIVQQLTQYPANIPLVENVALTDHHHPSRHDTPGHESKPWPKRHPNLQMHVTARPDGYSVYDETFKQDVCTFFDMVAPTLRTLHLSFYSSNLSIYFEIFRPTNGRVYPQLKEIAYRGAYGIGLENPWTGEDTMSAGGNGIIPARTGRKTFPRLRRLWLSGAVSCIDGAEEAFLSDLAKGCPGLTHLSLHEEHADTLEGVLRRLMRWHGVRLGESFQFVAQIPGASSWDQQQHGDAVAVLESNAFLGFPHLQRLIIDLRPDNRNSRYNALDKTFLSLIRAVARKRREVVIRRCHGCTRARAPLAFIRDLFERSVSGDSEVWYPKNTAFEEDAAKRWQPIRVGLPTYSPALMYRANIALPSPQPEDWSLPS